MLSKRFPVLDQGYVELLETMPSCQGMTDLDGARLDMAVVNAARISYLGESKGEEKDKKLLYYLIDNGHWGPFEMVEWKFRVKAPVVVWWQWVRHRTWNYNFQSGRYTEFQDELYIPGFDDWRTSSSTDKQASEGKVDHDVGIVLTLNMRDLWAQAFRLYKNALDKGVAKEQARLFLPAWGLYYTAYAKVDTRNLIHFLQLRRTDHAQSEIREYAKVIEEMLKTLMPWTYGKVFDNETGNSIS